MGQEDRMSDDDAGLFGPRTVTWELHSDALLWVAGLRALFLQALHPLALAGVEEHSSFRADPWGRLMRTAGFIGVATYGTRREALDTARMVNRAHRPVRGVDPVTGAPYRAADPELLGWVHTGLVDSILVVLRRSGRRVSGADADRYLAEMGRFARLVGLRASDVPRSESELADYYERLRPRLLGSNAARSAASFVLRPPMPVPVALATPARPAWAAVARLAYGTLPAWARETYALRGVWTTDRGTDLGLRALRLATRALPPGLREGPHLREARRRLAA